MTKKSLLLPGCVCIFTALFILIVLNTCHIINLTIWFFLYSAVMVVASWLAILLTIGLSIGYYEGSVRGKNGTFRPYETVIDSGNIAYGTEPGLLIKHHTFWIIIYSDGGECIVSHPDNLIKIKKWN